MGRKTGKLNDIISDFDFFISTFASNYEDKVDDEKFPEALHLATAYAYQLAIAHLLHTGDCREYKTNLLRSAQYRVRLLKQAAQDPAQYQDYSWSYFLAPFFGAIIAGDTDLAKEIATLSVFKENSSFEFHDEYLYSRILYQLVLSDYSASEQTTSLLGEYLDDWSGEETPRYRAVNALLEKKQIQFEKAIRDLLEAHGDYYSKIGEGLVDDLVAFSTEQFVCLEAVALVTIANRLGIKTQKHYKGIPSSALITL